MDAVSSLERSYQRAGEIVAGMSPDQLSLSSPCAGWDLRQTLNHTVGAVTMFTMANQGQPIGGDAGDIIGNDPAGALAGAARANLDSWRKPGGLDGDRVFPFGTFPAHAALMINMGEVLVHGWDVARATSQDETMDPDAVKMVWEFYAPLPLDEFRAHGAFGPEVSVPDDAPMADRLLGYLGRQP
jgi:uncharacterized protein (TIGR03086 family)